MKETKHLTTVKIYTDAEKPDMDRLELQFTNPVFHDGLNVSVRRGTKWAISINEITIGGKDALIRSRKVLRCVDISDEDLRLEHDPSCTTKKGIISEMKRVYPGFQEEEIVIVLFFEFINHQNE